MTVAAELGKSLDLHKRLGKSPNVHLRAYGGQMRLTSASAAGLVLVTRVKSSDEFDSCCVGLDTLSSFVRGSRDVGIKSDGQRLVLSGHKVRGEIPAVTEDSPRLRLNQATKLHSADAAWLREIIPLAALPGLDKSGLFSAECSEGKWSLSCADAIHGACAFTTGNSNAHFSLTPGDALLLSSLLSMSGDEEPIRLGFESSALVIEVGGALASIPMVEGTPQSRDTVIEGTTVAATLPAGGLKVALQSIQPFAQAKDAPPVSLTFRDSGGLISSSSSAGSITRAIQASTKAPFSVKLSFELLSSLTSRIADSEVIKLRTLSEGGEITRITLQTQAVYYLMLTSS